MKTKQQIKDVKVTQGGVNYTNRARDGSFYPFMGKVVNVYPQRMACDIETPDGQKYDNVPCLTKAGLKDGKPYGVFDMPALDDYVICMNIKQGSKSWVIIGTFIPYLSNEYTADVVNSGSKENTKKLLEKTTEDHYKRVFKSGTSLEIKADGTIIVEAPSGAVIKVDEDLSSISVADSNGNWVELGSPGIYMEDSNGNTVSMEATKVVINNNFEVLQ